MDGPEHETLTAALRRLADEQADGLLSVAAPGADVVIELAAGAPIAIGPTHDVTDRTGEGADAGVTTAVVVDELVDRTVAAVVGGDVEWSWDVPSPAERVPLPEGLAEELARRAVDAAQALQTVGTHDVLLPGEDLETTGELDRVRQLFDGARTVEEVADAASLTVPTVATMAAALVEAGALHRPDQPEEDDTVADADEEAVADDALGDEPWTSAMGAADEDDDEPELWVMGAAEDGEDGASREDDEDDEATGSGDVATTPSVTEPVRLPADRTAADDDAEDPVGVAPVGEWNDTSWLDDLASQDEDDEPPLFEGRDEPGTREALGSVLADLQGGTAAPTPRPTPAPTPTDEADDTTDEDGAPSRGTAQPLERGTPKAEPGDVAEFLRELSRLALEDD